MVYLAIKNIITKRPSKKLDHKYLGPYKVIKKISKNNYQLDLPSKVRIHPIFYVSLLKNATDVEPINIKQDNVEIKEKNTKQKKFSTYVTIKEKSNIWLNKKDIKTVRIYKNQLIIL